MTSTLYFEKKYGVNFKDIRTTDDIDHIIEKQSGQKIQMSKTSCGIIDKAGKVCSVLSIDINSRIDAALRRK